MMNNWIFLGGHCKTRLFLEVISKHSRDFPYGQDTELEYFFGGLLTFNYFWGCA